MAHPGETLKMILSGPAADAGSIASFLDGLSLPDKIRAVRSLSGAKLQGTLWRAAAGAPRVTVSEMVPPDYPRLRPLIFHGKNSLPAFTDFQKICFRPEQRDAGDVAWGYNETRIRNVIGPGYYVLHDTAEGALGGAAFDYTQLPDSKLPAWPEIRSNHAGLSRFVYDNMVDFMRRVASDVFIGSAVRGGREMNSYFVVVRELLAR